MEFEWDTRIRIISARKLTKREKKQDEEETVEADDMRPEYDLRKLKLVGRGVYAERYRSGTNLVLLEPDVRAAFTDDEAVNEALRVIAKAAKQQTARVRKSQVWSRRPTTRLPNAR